MKRPSAADSSESLTAEQTAKIGRSFEPIDLRSDKKLLEYLLYISHITLNMTQPIDLESYEEEVHVNPMVMDYYPTGDRTREGLKWDPAQGENFSHFPLIAIGEGSSNHSFCQVSVQTGDYGTLYVSFRPFIMEGLDDLFTKRGVWGALQNFRGREKLTGANTQHDASTLKNLLYLMNVVSHKGEVEVKTLDGDVWMGAGYHELLTATRSQLVVENDFLQLAAKDAGTSGIERLVNAHAAGFRTGNVRGTSSIVRTLCDFIAAYQPESVIFSGFSLGGGSSTAAAFLCHARLIERLETMPRFHCTSLAGTMVGGGALREYIAKHFTSCLTVKVVGMLGGMVVTDPVSEMPFSSRFVHPGRVLLADYNTKGFTEEETAPPVMNRAMPAWALMLSQVKVPGASLLSLGISKADQLLATAFDKIHLTGEDMIPRLAALQMLRRGYKTPMLNNVTCDWFTGTGTAAKYGVCYEDTGLCSLDDVEEALSKRAKGAAGTARTRPRSACVRTSLQIPIAVTGAQAAARKTYRVRRR